MTINSLNSLKVVSFTIFSYILFVNFLMINLFHIQQFDHEFFAAFKILKTNAAALSFYIVFYNLFVYTSQSSLRFRTFLPPDEFKVKYIRGEKLLNFILI